MSRAAKTKTLRIEEEPCIWVDSKGRYAWEVLKQYEDGGTFRKGGACKDLTAAVVKRDAALAQFESGRLVQRYTVRGWATHCIEVLWAHDVADGLIKADTVASHLSILNNHILPLMGDMWLDAVGSAQITLLKERLIELGRDEDTRANIRNTGSKLYSTALAQTPAAATQNPFKVWKVNRTKAKRDKDTGHKMTHKRVLTAEEEASFLSWAVNHWAYGMVLVALKMGLRKGEITGMTWRNIDWERQQYYVEEQVRRSRATGKLVVEDLKTDVSERYVPIHSAVMEFFKEANARPDRHPVKIFCNTNGNWISPEDADEAIEDLRMIAGLTNQTDDRGSPLPDPGWHDLRHTFATNVANSGLLVPLRTLMELLGHSDIETTYGYYASSSFADKRNAIDAI